jgi:hypothetical protein
MGVAVVTAGIQALMDQTDLSLTGAGYDAIP